MASNQNLKDLQWLQQVLESGILQKVTFFLSHQTSGCYQETETSISINLSEENNGLFSYLLKQLSTMQNHRNTASLRNMEFHRVLWEAEYLNSLKSLLENNHGIKHLAFRRNDFRMENVKEIMFCESRIGTRGAALIAEALKMNDSLEELQIWEDSIGLKGAEELSKMIEVNTSLKLLTVFDSSSIIAPHLLLRLDISGACRITCSLGMNLTVKVLDMTGVKLKSKWAREFRWVLEQNRTLKEVKLSRCCLKDKGVVYISAGLFKNRKLETLQLDKNWFAGVGVEHLLCPLSRFTALQLQANTTLKSLTFGGERMRLGKTGLEAILQMITTNQSLTRLGIMDDQRLRPGDIVRIFQGLEKKCIIEVSVIERLQRG
ncbi:Protein TORNADO 1 [Bienertia sinuspersici]